MQGERQGARAADRPERLILLAGLRGGGVDLRGIDLGVLDPVLPAAGDPRTQP
jgi:hypothetical protein